MLMNLNRTRRKLQLERLVKGAAILVTFFLLGSLLSTYVLARHNFADGSLFWARLLGLTALLALFGYYLFYPVLRPPSKGRVARFLEEQNPDLEESLSTAVELQSNPDKADPEIRFLVTRDARRRLARWAEPRFYHPQRSLISSLALFCSLVALGLLFFTGPEVYPYSLNKLIRGWFDQAQPPLYSIEVRPGNTTVGKRSDLEIRASLRGFNADKVQLHARYENHLQWEETEMHPDREGTDFLFAFFDVRDRIDYFVSADGIESERYTIQVSEIPRVEELTVHLRFPPYTGLADVTLENDADIRALVGTRAEFQVRTDQPVQNGSLKLESGRELALEMAGPRDLRGTLVIREDDFYRILAQDLEGFWNPASDEYIIEALEDQPPVLSFARPGRDQKVTNIEEVFTQIRAEDDYGIEKLALRFSVNGAPEQEAELTYSPGSRSTTTTHTFYLEEFALQPGDFISYYAQAEDASSSSSSDIYFLEVQPYDREYYQSQQSGGMGGMGAQDTALLSKRQKEIIAGTFNLQRRRAHYTSGELEEHSHTLALVQQRLQSEAQTIVERIQRRGVMGLDERFQKMMEHLNQAIQHMEPAHRHLNQQEIESALPEEQKAFQQLLRSEAFFKEIQMSFAQSQGGGGASAEELADLVDLELDRTKNQYETLQQNRRMDQERALDETLEKLRELARRQEQLVQRHRQQAMQSGSSGGNLSQQELIEETERLLRQLERLTRQQQDPQMDQINRQLREALRDMRQAQAKGQNNSQAQMRAQQALQRLQEAERSLSRQRQSQRETNLADLRRESERLAREQTGVTGTIQELDRSLSSGKVDQKYIQQLRKLLNKKAELQEELQQLEGNLHQAARQLGSHQAEASRKLKEAALDIRDQRLPEKMQEGSELLARGWNELARQREEGVSRELGELAEKVRQAEEALGPERDSSPREELERALAEVGTLLENLESLEARASRQGDRQQESEQGEGSQEGSSDDPQAGETAGSQGGAADQQGQGSPESQGGGGESRGSQAGIASHSFGIHPRQVGREWRERLEDAGTLRRQLREHSELEKDVASLIRRMRRIDAERLFSDPEEIARLKAQIIDGFRQLELDINRALQEDLGNLLRLVNQDEIPPEYRQRVEEYYRALASRKNPRP